MKIGISKSKQISNLIIATALVTLGVFGLSTDASSLSYSSDIGVSFTFLPTLKITLSSDTCNANLCILDLAPGTASDSNIITINVLNNTGNGYTLNATVGSDTLGTGSFNTRNLVHSNSSTTNTFTSLDFGSSIASHTNFNDNTWGYAYMDETLSNPSWSNYSGLPLYSDTTNITTLKSSLTPVTSETGDNIKFKIAAKASNSQTSGEYNNVINFTVTSQPIPVTLSMAYENAGKTKHNGYYKLQDMNTNICNATEVLDEGSQMQAIDIRDNKVYWITKLQDGKCWMTQNLDHDISTSFAYTPDNTDIPANWTPDKSTYTTITWDATSATFNIQQSYDPGNKIWDGTLDSTGNTNLSNMTQGTNLHYHIGNYYSWSAAVAMNDTSAYVTDNQDANQSICPAGWMLPKSGSITTAGSFQYLVDQYNFANDQMTNPHIWEAPLYFTLSGSWNARPIDGIVGVYGSSHSPIAYSPTYAYFLNFGSDASVDPMMAYYRDGGRPVRCVNR